MKDKINKLSKGIFEYEKPQICVSEDQISIVVESEKSYEGSFKIYSNNHQEIRARVFSTNKRMTLKSEGFIGSEGQIEYQFDGNGLNRGEVVEGSFHLITNGGEKLIPYTVEICQPFCTTSIGRISDLSQFTALAQSNWHEAFKLFRAPIFSETFLIHKQYAHIYEMLTQGKNMNQAMEEFLCTIKRKKPVNINVDEAPIVYENVNERLIETLQIKKENWGYQKIYITAVGDFIQLHKKEITTQDFLDDTYQLEYMIMPALFKYGNNFGKIIIQTMYKRFEVNISCINTQSLPEKVLVKKSMIESLCEISDGYLQKRLGKIAHDQWKAKIQESIDYCLNKSQDVIFKLYEAHYLILDLRKEEANTLLNKLNGREILYSSVTNYCYYMYLCALSRDDESYLRYAVDKIRDYYQGRYEQWEILWMLLTLTDKISDNKRYSLIKNQYQKGCFSPLLYLEAMTDVIANPALLREFDSFEVQLINWANKENYISKEVIERFVDIAFNGTYASNLALNILAVFYDQSDDENLKQNIIAAICAMLIRSGNKEKKYHIWYKKGIELSLKMQGLYEKYIDTISDEENEEIPLPVLLYFNYDNQLLREQKALLYAYIIKYKDAHEKIYFEYENIMKAFTHEQLTKGYVTKNMGILYNHFITSENMNAKSTASLPNILFKYEIKVSNPWIGSVIVAHRDLEKTSVYYFQDGSAFADIYMDDYRLIFVDKKDNRYIGTMTYELSPLMDQLEFASYLESVTLDQQMFLVNQSERIIKYQLHDDNFIDILRRTLKLPYLDSDFRKSISKNLIDYYQDHYHGETLEKYILQLELMHLDNVTRGAIIDYYIQRGLYDIAYDAVEVYGFDNIQDKKIMRLCSRKIRENGLYENSLLTKMCEFVFENGKYDDLILEYLIKFNHTTTQKLHQIWLAAKNFEVSAYELEEDLLCQMLFSEYFVSNTFEIFASYYSMKPNPKIVKAFLAYHSYKYLVDHVDMPQVLFSYIEMEYDQMVGAANVCGLALLKYYSTSEKNMKTHENWIVTKVNYFIEQGIVLPFFKNFMIFEQLPSHIFNKTFIEWRTKPNNKVTIYYQIGLNGLIQESKMEHVFCGIFIKTFTLFESEQLLYYIKEESEDGYAISDSMVIDGKTEWEKQGHSGIKFVNSLMTMINNQEIDKFQETITQYHKKQKLTKTIFELI